VRRLCDETGTLLILDEIQTGMGRTGRLFAHQHNDILPDVMTLAKGLGNGVPIGACLARGLAAELLGPGKHGSTFGGNPLVCRVGQTVLETLDSARLTERAGLLGQHMLEGFEARLQGKAGVRSIRGLGLMIGIELDRPCGELVTRALQQGLLINVTADTVVRLLPPLIISQAEADQMVNTVSGLIEDFL
jgi:acetylornithine aminotransferase